MNRVMAVGVGLLGAAVGALLTALLLPTAPPADAPASAREAADTHATAAHHRSRRASAEPEQMTPLANATHKTPELEGRSPEADERAAEARTSTADAAGTSGHDPQRLRELVRKAGPRDRFKLMGALVATKTPAVTDALCEWLLNDPDPEIRYEAAFALARVADRRAEGALILASQTESKDSVRVWVLQALGRLETRGADTELARVATDTTAALAARLSAVKALGEGGSERAAEVLARIALDAEELSLTLASVSALSIRASESALAHLKRIGSATDDAIVRERVGSAITGLETRLRGN